MGIQNCQWRHVQHHLFNREFHKLACTPQNILNYAQFCLLLQEYLTYVMHKLQGKKG